MIYLLFLGSLLHAVRQGRFVVLELLWTCLYGFLLEWLTLKQLHAYQYGHFLIMLDDTPLCIAMGWSVVIYSGMRFSSRLELPDVARPILAALMGLNIDLALDVIAIRLGMWTWNGIGANQQWFGVPWVNFWAWFIIIWSYSGFLRALRPWQRHRWRRWLYAPLAILLSLLILITASGLYLLASSTIQSGALTSLALIIGSLVIVLNFQPRVTHAVIPESLITAIPLMFHLFAAAAGIGYGIFAKQPILGMIGIALLVIDVIIHFLLWHGSAQIEDTVH